MKLDFPVAHQRSLASVFTGAEDKCREDLFLPISEPFHSRWPRHPCGGGQAQTPLVELHARAFSSWSCCRSCVFLAFEFQPGQPVCLWVSVKYNYSGADDSFFRLIGLHVLPRRSFLGSDVTISNTDVVREMNTS